MFHVYNPPYTIVLPKLKNTDVTLLNILSH